MEKTNHEMRASLKNKKRIVIKVGSASITHKETGSLDLRKIEKLVRVISDLNAEGKDVILVSSGAIATGRATEYRAARAACGQSSQHSAAAWRRSRRSRRSDRRVL